MKFVKILFSVLAIWAGLEAIAWTIPLWVPLEIQQKYFNLEEKTDHSYTGRYLVNGRGARGDWPKSKEIQIAALGSSIMSMHRLDDDQTWTYLLEKNAPRPIHIDNYGLGYNKLTSAKIILESILRNRIHYDVLILELTASLAPAYQTLSMSYYARWMKPPDAWCYSCVLFKRFFNRRLNAESKLPPFSLLPKSNPTAEVNPKQMIRFDNSEFKSLLKAGLLTDVQPRPPFNLKLIEKEIDEVLNLALRITPNVIYMPAAVAYHPQMKPSYLQNYRTVLKSPKKNYKGETLYFNAASIAKEVNQLNYLLDQKTSELGLKKIDWISRMISLLPTTDGLFYDEYHLSEPGSHEVFNYIAPDFYRYIDQRIKN